jgi:hypothetical protein
MTGSLRAEGTVTGNQSAARQYCAGNSARCAQQVGIQKRFGWHSSGTMPSSGLCRIPPPWPQREPVRTLMIRHSLEALRQAILAGWKNNLSFR